MIAHVKMVVVGLSFCWRGRCRQIQSIQFRAKAKVVYTNEVLASSACEKLQSESAKIHRAETVNPLIRKRSLCH